MHAFRILLVWMLWSGTALAACAPDVVWLRGEFGQARFAVEIADDSTERAQGLMHRTSMPLSAGMLFVYEQPGRLSFWMRNTLIELDMLFVDPQGIVKTVHHRAQPLDETPILGGDGLTHVLEINGGLARQIGIVPGAQLRHPSFDQSQAAWPC
ncbi:MAG: DUF192 domain-containing protein [Pseudomonadota bacterium]